MRPGCVQGDHALAYRTVLDAGADLADGPGAEVAHDVGDRGEIAHSARE